MKKKYQPHGFAARLTPAWREYQARLFQRRAARATGQAQKTTASSRAHQRGASSRSSVASGDGNSDDVDPEPERRSQPSLTLYDQASLADLLCINKKTLQNQYSVAPHTLPKAISIPGARGPRWTPKSVQEWLSERPQHTSKSAPVAPRKRVGRPRIALVAGKGGAQ